jgi:hypothetical protein
VLWGSAASARPCIKASQAPPLPSPLLPFASSLPLPLRPPLTYSPPPPPYPPLPLTVAILHLVRFCTTMYTSSVLARFNCSVGEGGRRGEVVLIGAGDWVG